jgi:hypothetical protein
MRRYSMLVWMRAAIALALVLATATPALAQSPERCQEDAESGEKKQGKFHIEYVNGKPVTVIDTLVQVCGKVPRPSVVYVLTAKNIDYEWESLKQDFMPLIVASVKKAPF